MHDMYSLIASPTSVLYHPCVMPIVRSMMDSEMLVVHVPNIHLFSVNACEYHESVQFGVVCYKKTIVFVQIQKSSNSCFRYSIIVI